MCRVFGAERDATRARHPTPASGERPCGILPRVSQRSAMLIRLGCFLGFGVLLALTPLLMDLVNGGLHGHGYSMTAFLQGADCSSPALSLVEVFR